MGFGLSASCSLPDNYPSAQFTEGLLDLRDNVFMDVPNFRTWYITSSEHTWLNRDPSYTAPGTPPVPVRTFIQQFIDGDPAWNHVGP
jgi:hypothetical protein